jgi:hypothetical protein
MTKKKMTTHVYVYVYMCICVCVCVVARHDEPNSSTPAHFRHRGVPQGVSTPNPNANANALDTRHQRC